MVQGLAASPGLTVVVGAGASVEPGCRRGGGWSAISWTGVRATVLGSLTHRSEGCRSTTYCVRRRRSARAAIAEALAGDDLASWIPAALYGSDAARFQPGPIARQVPVLRAAFGSGLKLLTTNYDDLLQPAFDNAAIGVKADAFAGPGGSPVAATGAAHQRVSHLHGFLARDGRRAGTVVLSEHDYQRVAQEDWQRSEVGAALMNSPCIFIGSSLTDPNLLRYLHTHSGPGSPQHFAIFTRQDVYPQDTPTQVIEAREDALAARWRTNNLEIVFVDHYAEIALALAEVARAKAQGDEYVLLPERLARWHTKIERTILRPMGAASFVEAQDLLHGALRIALRSAVKTVDELGHETRDEVLAATLWLVDADAETLTSWATTDRVHRDPATIEPVPITEHSNWVAVRAFCRGVALGEPRDVYASRWKYIRGLPSRRSMVSRSGRCRREHPARREDDARQHARRDRSRVRRSPAPGRVGYPRPRPRGCRLGSHVRDQWHDAARGRPACQDRPSSA